MIKKPKKGFKKSRKKYQNRSEEEKNKKPEYSCEQYKNLSKDEKPKLVEYRKKCYKTR